MCRALCPKCKQTTHRDRGSLYYMKIRDLLTRMWKASRGTINFRQVHSFLANGFLMFPSLPDLLVHIRDLINIIFLSELFHFHCLSFPFHYLTIIGSIRFLTWKLKKKANKNWDQHYKKYKKLITSIIFWH